MRDGLAKVGAAVLLCEALDNRSSTNVYVSVILKYPLLC